MPKEVVVIDQFQGGQDSNTDPRDIAFEDSTSLINIESSENLDTDKRGKLRLSGSFKNSIFILSPEEFTYLGDYSDKLLQSTFLFGSDYSLLNPEFIDPVTRSATIAEGEEIEYTKPTLVPLKAGTGIAVYDTSAAGVAVGTVFSEGVDGEPLLDFTEQTDEEFLSSHLDPIYYVAEGGLVVSNSNFSGPEVGPLLLKLCKRTLMQHTWSEHKVSEWYVGSAKPSVPPGGGLVNLNVYYQSAGLVTFDLVGSLVGSGNNMMESLNADWEFGSSYQVDEFEESDIELWEGYDLDLTSASNTDAPYIKMSVKCDDISVDFGPRVTAQRVYMRIVGSVDWYLLVSIDFKKATWYMPTWGPTYYDLKESTPGSGDYLLELPSGGGFPSFGILPLEDYQYYAGRAALDTGSVQYKTAVVSGKRAWVGHVRKDGVVYGDRMLKSVVRQYNVFPEENWIDVVTDDGDDIVKLEAFADRILQFKRSTLYIINVPPQGGEFLEAQFPGYGIDYPSASTLTPNGVVFANIQGLFLYDAEKISNLLIQGKVSKVSKQAWKDFTVLVDDDGKEIPRSLRVGFDPNDDIVHIYNQDKKGYRVSLINKAISQASDVGGLPPLISNLYTFRNRMYAFSIDETGYTHINYWDKTSQSNTIELITRDFDLGEPSIRKKVYRIWITYKANGPDGNNMGVFVYFAVNGSKSFTRSYATSADTFTDTDGRLKSTNDIWKQVWFKPNSSDVNNIYSIQIKISSEDSGTLNADGNGICIKTGFEIDDISFVHRRKRAR